MDELLSQSKSNQWKKQWKISAGSIKEKKQTSKQKKNKQANKKKTKQTNPNGKGMRNHAK